MKEIANPVARIWTNAQLKETVQQSREAGLRVEKEPGGGFLTITDLTTGNVVLRSLQTVPGMNVVRYDESYFDGSRKSVYVYIDKSGLVVYCMDRDNISIQEYSGMRRYVVSEKYLKVFFNYFELRFHPLVKTIK